MKTISAPPTQEAVSICYENELLKLRDIARRLNIHLKLKHETFKRDSEKGGAYKPVITSQQFDWLFDSVNDAIELLNKSGGRATQLELDRVARFRRKK